MRQIRDAGARKHHTRTTAKSKDEPRGNQQVDVRSQGTACRRRDGHHRTNDEEAVPAAGVGKRTNEELSQRHADHKRREGQLHQRRCGVEVGGDSRKRREVHVDGKGATCRQQRECR